MITSNSEKNYPSKKIFKEIIAPLLILAILGAIIYFSLGWWQTKKLENLAKKHPKGAELLAQIKEWEQKLKDNDSSNDLNGLMIIGFNKNTLGDFKGAELAYEKALKINPKDTIALNNLANVKKELKKFSEAEKNFLAILDINPAEIRIWREVADLYRYYLIEKKSQIEPFILKGLSFNPGHPDLLSYLAAYFRDEKNTQKAIYYFEKLIEVSPENEAAKIELEQLKDRIKN